MDLHNARYLWQLIEPYHAVTYFSPVAIETYESVGLKGGWMGYFAGRSAAMGAVGPGVVTATFFNFHPEMVARSIPDAWKLSTPHDALLARLQIADAELIRILGERVHSDAIAEAAELALRAARAGAPSGRPLYAAHVALPLPGKPHLDLWAACTALREHRGDGHVACLVEAGLDGCEANVLAAAARAIKPETQKKFRGWSDTEWGSAAERLAERGLVEEDHLTEEGQALRDRYEGATDRLAAAPYEVLGNDGIERLISLMEEISMPIVEAEVIRYPNPMGLTRPQRLS